MPRQPSKKQVATDKQAKRQQPEMESRQAPEFRSLYSNNIHLRMLPWDIQLTFGEILSADESKVVVESRVAVNLSPQTAKSLLKVLAGIVQRYEAQIGEIKYGERQEPSDADV